MISLFSLSVPLPYHRYWQSVTGARVYFRDISSLSREMTTKHIAPANLRWLKTSEVCDLLGITDETLSKWRVRGCAPDFIRLPNGDLRYSQVAIDDFIGLCQKRRAKNAR
jgi:predicted DNA-binding transcriptional regulator AlpA